MTRTDRVMDLLDLLRVSEVQTVEAIAEILGVCGRTVLRDLASLKGRGWPIRTDSGPGGGIYLDRDRGLRAVHLTVDEVASLWLAAQLSRTAGDLPWSHNARSALNKVFASIPEERQRRLRALVKRVVVSRAASQRVLQELGKAPPELLNAFDQAFRDNLCLGFHYIDRHGNETQRIAEPHGLLVEPPAWYLLSRDAESGQPRMFRMDRIRRVRVLVERSFTPDFDGLRRQHEAIRVERSG